MAELVAEHAETAGGITGASRRLDGRTLFDEVGTEGFVLAMKRPFGGEGEGGGLGFRIIGHESSVPSTKTI
jgi:hypothetical protein